jgi:lipopolysaccharide biosynthesis glycosyltransferase
MAVKILFTCDGHYLKPMALCALTIRENLPRRLRLKAYLLYSGISIPRIALYAARLRLRGIELVAMRPDFRRTVRGLPLTYHFTEHIYYRILAPLCLEDEKVLYLDPDIIALDSIAGLWETNLGGKTCGAVVESMDPEHKAAIGLGRGAPYFNSGVLLLNLGRLRERMDELMAWIRENSARVLWPDQDALNAVLADDWMELDGKWNRPSERYLSSDGEAMLLHFAGSSKPWHLSSNDPFRRVYLSAVKRYFPLDFAALVTRRWAGEIKRRLLKALERRA